MSRPPFDLKLIDALTPATWAAGHRLLQTHLWGESEAQHVLLLLDSLDARRDGTVVDMGSGFGETTRLMRERRPDLLWVLVNLSMAQHRYATQLLGNDRVRYVLADAHDTGLPAGSVDAVMFNSALVQMDERVALKEAHRLLRPRGRLMVNELTRDERVTDGREMEEKLACRCLTRGELIAAIETSGFDIDQIISVRFSTERFRAMLAKEQMEHLLTGLAPVIVTATKWHNSGAAF